MASLILASSSPYRRELLGRLGLDFFTEAADVDETRAAAESPRDLAIRLARAKADAVAARHPEAWVIGSDQVIALEDRVFSKPGSHEAAVAQLLELAGVEHQLITAVCVASPRGMEESVTTFAMHLRELTRAEIEAYVREEEPLDCAGSYRIEAGGIRLFEHLRGDDFTAIIGLPLTAVGRLLRETGYPGS